MDKLHAVLDTNVLVSGLAYPNSIPGRIVNSWRQGGIDVSLSHYILDELVRVLPSLPKITLNGNEIRDLADSFMFLANMVEPDASVQNMNLRDPADQPVLATFVACRAQYLIAGDKDLLALAKQYSIITPSDFWNRHLAGV
jgi:putative PIN family toxin of toxin-antitoxin system